MQTFYVSHADVTELTQLLSSLIRLPSMAVQPAISSTRRATRSPSAAPTRWCRSSSRIIEQNDKPRAEIVFDVEILEVDRERAKSYGLNLSEYALGGDLLAGSVAESATRTTSGTGTGAGTARHDHDATGGRRRRRRRAVAAAVQPEHDFARHQRRPTSIWRCRRRSCGSSRATRRPSSWPSRSCAAPKATKLTLNLGDEVPCLDQLHADRHRRRRRQPAELVPAEAGRHQHRHHAARHARRRHPARPDVESSSQGRRRQRRRHELSVVRIAQGRHAAAAARRRIEPARRPAARGRAEVAERISRARFTCRS